MVVPEGVYKRPMPIRPLSDEAFWSGEAPVPMRGSFHVRRWIHDRRYNIRDGYLFDLRKRYLQRFKVTAVAGREVRDVWHALNVRIGERRGVEGRKFYDGLQPYEMLLDGKVTTMSEGALLLAAVADALEEVGERTH